MVTYSLACALFMFDKYNNVTGDPIEPGPTWQVARSGKNPGLDVCLGCTCRWPVMQPQHAPEWGTRRFSGR